MPVVAGQYFVMEGIKRQVKSEPIRFLGSLEDDEPGQKNVKINMKIGSVN